MHPLCRIPCTLLVRLSPRSVFEFSSAERHCADSSQADPLNTTCQLPFCTPLWMVHSAPNTTALSWSKTASLASGTELPSARGQSWTPPPFNARPIESRSFMRRLFTLPTKRSGGLTPPGSTAQSALGCTPRNQLRGLLMIRQWTSGHLLAPTAIFLCVCVNSFSLSLPPQISSRNCMDRVRHARDYLVPVMAGVHPEILCPLS